MWTLHNLLFLLCTALSCVTCAAGVIQVFGYEGRNVSVSCSYDDDYENYEKYLCRDDCGSRDVLITTSQTNKTKYSIYDDRRSRIVTATISALGFTDAGKYWCGVSRKRIDLYTEVKLKISPDSCCNNMNKIQSDEDGFVSIWCPYDRDHINNLKYICRGKQPSTCLQQALITSDRQNRRFRQTDDRKSRTFMVTIYNLTLEDSGPYLCGVQRKGRLDDFYAVELEVKEVYRTAAPVTVAATVQMFWSAEIFTSQTPLPPVSGELISGVFLLYVLSAVLVLLMISFVLLMVFKNKSKNLRGGAASLNVLNTAASDEETRINDIYETRVAPPRTFDLDSVYCNLLEREETCEEVNT